MVQYIKQTYDHQYLHYQSSHPLHIKTSLPYSHALRVGWICSSEKDFKTYISRMKELFLAKGCPKIVVNNQKVKVVFGRDQSVEKTLERGIPFVNTYNPKVKELGRLIRELLPFSYRDEEVQKAFSPPPRKIKDDIVRSKLYPVERKVGWQWYGNYRCHGCKSININEEYTNFTINKTY